MVITLTLSPDDGDEMEDWSWDDYDDEYGGTDPHQDMNNHLADCFPTRDSEYQDEDGNYVNSFFHMS